MEDNRRASFPRKQESRLGSRLRGIDGFGFLIRRLISPAVLLFGSAPAWAEAAATNGPLLRELSLLRRCYDVVRSGDPVQDCDEALRYWVDRRTFCSPAATGVDYILAPVGTVRRYRREFAEGRGPVDAAERVEHLMLREDTTLEVWIRRWADRVVSLASFLVDPRSGAVRFDSLHVGGRVVNCHRPEVFLPGEIKSASSWYGTGCWLTDSVSHAVYPHAFRSVFAELFVPGTLVKWKYSFSSSAGAVTVPAGRYAEALVRRSVPVSPLWAEAEFEEAYVAGVGRVSAAAYRKGNQVWGEKLMRVEHPYRPRDPESFCR